MGDVAVRDQRGLIPVIITPIGVQRVHPARIRADVPAAKGVYPRKCHLTPRVNAAESRVHAPDLKRAARRYELLPVVPLRVGVANFVTPTTNDAYNLGQNGLR